MNPTTTTHTNLPPPPSPSFAALPTEILFLIIEQLHLDAKELYYAPYKSLSTTEDHDRSNHGLSRTLPYLPSGFDRDIQRLYSLVRVLGEENGVADLVRFYADPGTKHQDSLRAVLDHCCDLERFLLSMSAKDTQSYQTLFILLNKYTPFLSMVAHNDSLLDDLRVLVALIPAVIICHCRNIKWLNHLTIGDRRGRNRTDQQFPSFHLEASPHWFFIIALSWGKRIWSTLSALVPGWNASCSHLKPAQQLGEPTPRDFAFLGPALVLRALSPLSQQLKALSIEYAPMLDYIFTNVPNDADSDDDDDINPDDNMDANENLVTHLGYFPNLKMLRICHRALRWTHSDGLVKEQLVRLTEGCPRLESLDITQIDIRDTQIRPQLEGLVAVAGTDAIPLLKGLRVGILKNQGRDKPVQWTRDDSCPHLSDLFAKEYLATYSKTGIKLLIDIESFWQKMAILQTFPAVHEGVHDTVTVHPYLDEITGAVQERESVARR
ncbi:uncharacterized protein B0T23DRAFT_403988 [Neurospora hispaniola]|uniref:F-box domain-containing protein n=1 Tax=Neurospora hispaniola TaxID=588809 RepID=A0AAJ0IB07_9PEZI|nr:hypothetical protein B0T23DRAFT_403988 [Neurospora hispaniola]